MTMKFGCCSDELTIEDAEALYTNDSIIPYKSLTVVIRDDGPMIYCNDCPSYRSVKIELT